MITIDGIEYFKKEELQQQSDLSAAKGDRAHTFLELGKVYAFRTVTMIYTGRLKAVSEQEFLITEAAWIPETERWMDFADTGAHKEAEPYARPIVLNRGSLLDCTEIPQPILKQK